MQVVSTMANTTLKDVAATSCHPCLLFQLYVIRDRALVTQWVRQAEAAGYKALVITVDAQRLVSSDLRIGSWLQPFHLAWVVEHTSRQQSQVLTGLSSIHISSYSPSGVSSSIGSICHSRSVSPQGQAWRLCCVML
jgi:isopentenyl diphosphate isomerase/L-lactate dehydrogenase-like FMN-dependent dehydrogenase